MRTARERTYNLIERKDPGKRFAVRLQPGGSHLDSSHKIQYTYVSKTKCSPGSQEASPDDLHIGMPVEYGHYSIVWRSEPPASDLHHLRMINSTYSFSAWSHCSRQLHFLPPQRKIRTQASLSLATRRGAPAVVELVAHAPHVAGHALVTLGPYSGSSQ